MRPDLAVRVGGHELTSPLIAASGTVGSVWEMTSAADVTAYGAPITKSVAGEEWPGRPPPRLAPAGVGMLNGIGIQNPGIESWASSTGPRILRVNAPVWGSAVGQTPDEYAEVATGLQAAAMSAVEINLSCPNLEDGRMFALDPSRSGEVVSAVSGAVSVPIGAKLSPNSEDIVAVAAACAEAGAAWVTLTNTAWGAGVDVESRRPLLSGGVGGYSGPPLKPIAMRCVIEVAAALPGLPIVGCGGVMKGVDVIEYLMAGASAVEIGTVHFAEPKAGRRILAEVSAWCDDHAVASVGELTGAMEPW
ncbi:dihydroorotate dehydrogenase [soil metagenome]